MSGIFEQKQGRTDLGDPNRHGGSHRILNTLGGWWSTIEVTQVPYNADSPKCYHAPQNDPLSGPNPTAHGGPVSRWMCPQDTNRGVYVERLSEHSAWSSSDAFHVVWKAPGGPPRPGTRA